MSTLTVTARGQVTFRKDILRHLGINPGEKVRVEMLPDGVFIRAAKPTGTIDDFIGMIENTTGRFVTLEEIDEAATAGWSGGQ